MRRLGHKKTLLHTQTHTWLAVKVYLDMGFEPYKMEESYLGWQIMKKLTNHEKLKNVAEIEQKDMYNPLYIQAYDFLKQHFQEPFLYKVWEEKESTWNNERASWTLERTALEDKNSALENEKAAWNDERLQLLKIIKELEKNNKS